VAFPLDHDEALDLKFLKKVDGVRLACGRIDVIFRRQALADLTDGDGRVDQLENPQADSIEAVASALRRTERHGLAVYFGKDQVLATPNNVRARHSDRLAESFTTIFIC
jgi:hypothetical protein